jgi:excisionase family DNA binding protein
MDAVALLTTEDVANFLKVDVVTVRRLVSRGDLAAYRIGGEFRFTESDLQQYLERQYLPARGSQAGTRPRAARLPGSVGFWLGTHVPARPRGSAETGERFTEAVRQVLALAQAEAEQRGTARIEPAHLLLALASHPSSAASRALRECGLSLEALRAALDQRPDLAGSLRTTPDQPLELSGRLREALEASVKQARQLKHDYVGTAHLLLGLVAGRAGAAPALLEALSVRPAALRKCALALLQSGQDAENPAA